MTEPKIWMKDINEIVPYGKNPRKNDKAVDAVANSIKEFGFKSPVIIDRNNTIVCGHTRVKAAKRLGMVEIPCIIADDLTDEQIKAYRLADNKTSELAEWDWGILSDELKNLHKFDMMAFGFERTDLKTEVSEDNYEMTQFDEPPKVKVGEIYRLGRHYLMCGDATSLTCVQALTGGETNGPVNHGSTL